MDRWSRIWFNPHARRQMQARNISVDDVLVALAGGEVIAGYPGDHPHPTRLILGLVGNRSLHWQSHSSLTRMR